MTGQPLVALAFPAIYVTGGNTNIELRNGSIVGGPGGGVTFDETVA